MNEHSFIKAVHRQLPKHIKVWKIIDDFHGGVSDVAYFGMDGKVLFVEYKFQPTLPVRGATIPQKLKLKPQQYLWFCDLQDRKVPVAAIFGVGEPETGGVWVTDRKEAKDGICKDEVLRRWESPKNLITHILRSVTGDTGDIIT